VLIRGSVEKTKPICEWPKWMHVSIRKGVMMILAVLGGEKTNPIQSQTKPILFSPQIYLGVENPI